MVSDRCFSIFPVLLLFVFSLLFTTSSSTSISGRIFQSQISIARTLLQAKKACPVNFEFQNYTVITSKCKGPRYAPNLCCSALTDFACPYAEELNDLSNDCASTMFSYINLYGRYPPGLFSSECRGEKEGLPCPAQPPSTSPLFSSECRGEKEGLPCSAQPPSTSSNINSASVVSFPLQALSLMAGFLLLLWVL